MVSTFNFKKQNILINNINYYDSKWIEYRKYLTSENFPEMELDLEASSILWESLFLGCRCHSCHQVGIFDGSFCIALSGKRNRIINMVTEFFSIQVKLSI